MMIKSKKLFLICFISVVIANNPLRVNHNRLNNNFIKLSKISSIEFGSLSRVAYTDADINGRKYVMELMISAGMDVKIDEGGNIIGKLKQQQQVVQILVMNGIILVLLLDQMQVQIIY